MVVKAIQIAKRIELVGYIICLLCLFWPWGKVSYLVPSQIDIVSNMQLVFVGATFDCSGCPFFREAFIASIDMG